MPADRPNVEPLRYEPENEARLRGFTEGLVSRYGRFRSGQCLVLPTSDRLPLQVSALLVGYNPATGCFRLAKLYEGLFVRVDRPAAWFDACNPPEMALQDTGRDFVAEARAEMESRVERRTRLREVSESIQTQMRETVEEHMAVFAATRDPAVVRQCRLAIEELDELHEVALLRLAAPFGDHQDKREQRAVSAYLEEKRREFARHLAARRDELRSRQEDDAREIQLERRRPQALRPAVEAATEFIRQLEGLEADWRARGCTPDEIAEKRDRAERIFRDAVARPGDPRAES